MGGPTGSGAIATLRVEGAGIVAGNTIVTKVYHYYGIEEPDLPPGYQELLGTKTHTVTAQNESNGFYTHIWFTTDVSLPTTATDPFAVGSPFPDPSFGDFGVTFETTITTPNDGLTDTVTAITTSNTTGSNANKFYVVWGDMPITVSGSLVSSQSPGPNQITSAGGVLSVQWAMNSTTDWDSSLSNISGGMHRKIEFINPAGNDIFGSGSPLNGQTLAFNNLNLASSTLGSGFFTVGDVFTLKVILGSGAWNSPTDDFRLTVYEQDFTVV